MYKIRAACDVIAEMTSFFKNMVVTSDYDVINSKPIFLKTVGEHQPAGQLCCSHVFWFTNWIGSISPLHCKMRWSN